MTLTSVKLRFVHSRKTSEPEPFEQSLFGRFEVGTPVHSVLSLAQRAAGLHLPDVVPERAVVVRRPERVVVRDHAVLAGERVEEERVADGRLLLLRGGRLALGRFGGLGRLGRLRFGHDPQPHRVASSPAHPEGGPASARAADDAGRAAVPAPHPDTQLAAADDPAGPVAVEAAARMAAAYKRRADDVARVHSAHVEGHGVAGSLGGLEDDGALAVGGGRCGRGERQQQCAPTVRSARPPAIGTGVGTRAARGPMADQTPGRLFEETALRGCAGFAP